MCVDLLEQLVTEVHRDQQEVGESPVNLDGMEILVLADQLEIQEVLGFGDNLERLVIPVMLVLLGQVVLQVRLCC